MKTALITGITGQDGSFLAEFLLEKVTTYTVQFAVQVLTIANASHILKVILTFTFIMPTSATQCRSFRSSAKYAPTKSTTSRPRATYRYRLTRPSLQPTLTPLACSAFLRPCVRWVSPILAASIRLQLQSFTARWRRCLRTRTHPSTPIHPYAVAKLYGFWIVKEYREAYNMYCCSGILFNHESERRGETFVTRKITLAAARIAQGKQEKLYLGNLSSLRDWGYAKDYVECMWLILQQDKPEDYVIATGEQHSVREFCQLAFRRAGIELRFEGEGADEKGIDVATGKVVIEVSPDFYRPTDVVNLWGDPTKAKAKLGWDPSKRPRLRSSSTLWSTPTWPRWLSSAPAKRSAPTSPSISRRVSLSKYRVYKV